MKRKSLSVPSIALSTDEDYVLYLDPRERASPLPVVSHDFAVKGEQEDWRMVELPRFVHRIGHPVSEVKKAFLSGKVSSLAVPCGPTENLHPKHFGSIDADRGYCYRKWSFLIGADGRAWLANRKLVVKVVQRCMEAMTQTNPFLTKQFLCQMSNRTWASNDTSAPRTQSIVPDDWYYHSIGARLDDRVTVHTQKVCLQHGFKCHRRRKTARLSSPPPIRTPEPIPPDTL
jgi:hypothetical protein